MTINDTQQKGKAETYTPAELTEVIEAFDRAILIDKETPTHEKAGTGMKVRIGTMRKSVEILKCLRDREAQTADSAGKVFITTRRDLSGGGYALDYKGRDDHAVARGRTASAHIMDRELVCLTLDNDNAGNACEERVIRGADAVARSEAAIRAWMEADVAWPGMDATMQAPEPTPSVFDVVAYTLDITGAMTAAKLRAFLLMAQAYALSNHGCLAFHEKIGVGDNGPVIPELSAEIGDEFRVEGMKRGDKSKIQNERRIALNVAVHDYANKSAQEAMDIVRASPTWKNATNRKTKASFREITREDMKAWGLRQATPN